METRSAEEILQEISRLRESLYKAYDENRTINQEVLLISTKLDRSINAYLKLTDKKTGN